MEKQTLPVVAKLLPICLTIAFTAMASAQIAPPGGGGGGAYGWRLVETTPIGKDVINTWRTLPTGAVAPLTLTREWGSDNWVTDEGLALGWQFPGIVSNSGFEPRPVSMTSSGTTRFKFKYFPAPGETPPSRAVFQVSPVSMAAAYGSSANFQASNGFGDPFAMYEFPTWASTGKHLLERSVGSDGTVVITLPSRRAEASSSGFNAGVWADASQCSAVLDNRRATINLPNYQAKATGLVLLFNYISDIGGNSNTLVYPEYQRFATPIEDSANGFNKATFFVGGPLTSVNRYGSQFPVVPTVNLPVTAEATLEASSIPLDTYSWQPGEAYSRINATMQTWFFDDWYNRKWDALVSTFGSPDGVNPGFYFLGLTYEWDGPSSHQINFKYRWASDNAEANSQRTLIFRPATQQIAEKVFTDGGNPMDPTPLSPWIDGSLSQYTFGSAPREAIVAGQSTIALVGIGSMVSGNIPVAVGAAAAGIALDLGTSWFESQEIIMPRGNPSFAPANNQPEPAHWRALENNQTEPFGEHNKPHFFWRIYYVPQCDVSLSAHNLYDLLGFRGQQVVETTSPLPVENCSRQIRFYHRLGGWLP